MPPMGDNEEAIEMAVEAAGADDHKVLTPLEDKTVHARES